MSDETKANEPPEFEDHPSQQPPQRRRQPLRTSEPSELPEFEETQPISFVEVPKAPPIPPEHMTDTQAVNQTTGTAPMPGVLAPATARSPWPMRIISAMIVVAMAAIILVLVLPRERTEGTPTKGTPDAAGPATEGQFGLPQDTAGGGTETPMPQTTTEGQTGTTYTNAEAYDSTGQQLPADSGVIITDANGVAVGGGAMGSGSGTGAGSAAGAGAAGGATGGSAPVGSPASGGAGLSGNSRQGFLLFISELRQEKYQDPDNWEIIKIVLPTTLLDILKEFPKKNIEEIINAIESSNTGAEAADKLEYIYNHLQQ